MEDRDNRLDALSDQVVDLSCQSAFGEELTNLE